MSGSSAAEEFCEFRNSLILTDLPTEYDTLATNSIGVARNLAAAVQSIVASNGDDLYKLPPPQIKNPHPPRPIKIEFSPLVVHVQLAP